MGKSKWFLLGILKTKAWIDLECSGGMVGIFLYLSWSAMQIWLLSMSCCSSATRCYCSSLWKLNITVLRIVMAKCHRSLGDLPLPVQFVRWLNGACGNRGVLWNKMKKLQSLSQSFIGLGKRKALHLECGTSSPKFIQTALQVENISQVCTLHWDSIQSPSPRTWFVLTATGIPISSLQFYIPHDYLFSPLDLTLYPVVCTARTSTIYLSTR